MNNKTLISFLKRQSFVICSSLVLIILGTIITSAAIYSLTLTSSKEQVVNSGDFNVTFANGAIISNDVFISSDMEGQKTAGYNFTVQNMGTIESTYQILLGRNQDTTYTATQLVSNEYIRYSIDGEPAQSLTSANIISGTSESDYLYSIKIVNQSSSASKTHNLKVWIDESVATSEAIAKYVDLSISVSALAADPGNERGYPFNYTGEEVIYTVPYTGTYTITASGAQGNVYDINDKTAKGGKGAQISADFNLKKGDILHIIVGGMGKTTISGGAFSLVSGAGGGGSFIFKEIPSIINPGYQFTKGTKNYDILLVAAGGNGSGDLSVEQTIAIGKDGLAASYISPTNYNAYSTVVEDESGELISNLGIMQYIVNDLEGGYYNAVSCIHGTDCMGNNKSIATCNGGFGGGGCQDDDEGLGGGWSTKDWYVYSFSQGENTVGIDGYQTGNGYVNIKLKG